MLGPSSCRDAICLRVVFPDISDMPWRLIPRQAPTILILACLIECQGYAGLRRWKYQ